MKLKKLMLPLAFLAFGSMFVSCDDDDDNVKYDEPTIVSDMEYDFDDDLLELCNVTVHYTDFTGTETSEQLTVGDWNQRLQSSTFPCTCKYRVEITRKPGVKPTKAKYDLEFTADYEAKAYYDYNRYYVIPEKETKFYDRDRVPAAEVDAAIEELIKKVDALNYNYTFTLGTDNKISYKQL